MTVGKVLFLILLVQKLTHDTDWSWWFVASPAICEIIVDAIRETVRSLKRRGK